MASNSVIKGKASYKASIKAAAKAVIKSQNKSSIELMMRRRHKPVKLSHSVIEVGKRKKIRDFRIDNS